MKRETEEINAEKLLSGIDRDMSFSDRDTYGYEEVVTRKKQQTKGDKK